MLLPGNLSCISQGTKGTLEVKSGVQDSQTFLQEYPPGFHHCLAQPRWRQGDDEDEPQDVVRGVSQDSLKDMFRLLPVGGRPPGPV